MYANLKFIDHNTKTEILIRQNKSVVYKIALWLMALMIIPSCIFALYIIIIKEKNALTLSLAIGAILALFVFVFKHLKTVYGIEKIEVNKEEFTYQHTFLGIGKYLVVKTNQIKKIEYVGYEKYITHELEIKGDGLGFGTGQAEINYLNQAGTVLLKSQKGKIRFGLNVDSEDFTDLNLAVKRYTNF